MRLRRQLLGPDYVLTVDVATYDAIVRRARDRDVSVNFCRRIQKARVDYDRNKAVIKLGIYDLEELLSSFLEESV